MVSMFTTGGGGECLKPRLKSHIDHKLLPIMVYKGEFELHKQFG